MDTQIWNRHACTNQPACPDEITRREEREDCLRRSGEYGTRVGYLMRGIRRLGVYEATTGAPADQREWDHSCQQAYDLAKLAAHFALLVEQWR